MYLKAVILSLLLAQTCLALYCRGRDWQRIGFKCYTFENRRMTYFAARSRCHARGGTMFEPENLRQFRAVAGRVQSPTWLGINDRYREGSFVYDSDNTLIPFTYWRYSQPDNGYMRHYFGSSDGQHCVAFNPRFRGSGWSDDNCRRFKYVICQTDPIRYHHDHGRHRSAALTTALAPVEPIANQAYMVSRSAAVVEPLLLAAGLKNGFTDGHTGMTMIGSHLPTDKPRCYAQANRLIVETQVRRKMSLRTCHRYCRASRLCKFFTWIRGGRCFLKNYRPRAAIKVVGVRSGTKRGIRRKTNIMYVGKVIRNVTFKESCKRACRRDRNNCKSYNFFSSSARYNRNTCALNYGNSVRSLRIPEKYAVISDGCKSG